MMRNDLKFVNYHTEEDAMNSVEEVSLKFSMILILLM